MDIVKAQICSLLNYVHERESRQEQLIVYVLLRNILDSVEPYLAKAESFNTEQIWLENLSLLDRCTAIDVEVYSGGIYVDLSQDGGTILRYDLRSSRNAQHSSLEANSNKGHSAIGSEKSSIAQTDSTIMTYPVDYVTPSLDGFKPEDNLASLKFEKQDEFEYVPSDQFETTQVLPKTELVSNYGDSIAALESVGDIAGMSSGDAFHTEAISGLDQAVNEGSADNVETDEASEGDDVTHAELPTHLPSSVCEMGVAEQSEPTAVQRDVSPAEHSIHSQPESMIIEESEEKIPVVVINDSGQLDTKHSDPIPKIKRAYHRIEDMEAAKTCPHCGKKFHNPSNLKVHLRSHEKLSPFSCDICDKGFTTRANKLRHESTTHRGERRFQCTICKKNFSEMKSLASHKQTVHLKERPYVCEQCGKAFTQSGPLRKHMNSHDKLTVYECEPCQKRFYMKEHLTAHMKRHLGVKDVQCQKCQKKFTSKSELQRHKMVHIDELPHYTCALCYKEFKTKEKLHDHMTTHSQLHIRKKRRKTNGNTTNGDEEIKAELPQALLESMEDPNGDNPPKTKQKQCQESAQNESLTECSTAKKSTDITSSSVVIMDNKSNIPSTVSDINNELTTETSNSKVNDRDYSATAFHVEILQEAVTSEIPDFHILSEVEQGQTGQDPNMGKKKTINNTKN